MKKVKSDELRPEYRREDLGAGVRGKHLEAYRAGTNLVLLSPDVAKVFPTQEAVNDALRSLIDIAQKSVAPKKRSSRRTKARGWASRLALEKAGELRRWTKEEKIGAIAKWAKKKIRILFLMITKS